MLSDQERQLLRGLIFGHKNAQEIGEPGAAWLRPMDLGGRNSSWHSRVLARLVKKGYAERRTRGSNRSYTYRWSGKEFHAE